MTDDLTTRDEPALQPPVRRPDLKVAAFTAAVIAAALAIHVLQVRGLQLPEQLRRVPPREVYKLLSHWGLLIAAFAAVEVAVVHVHVRKSAQTFSLSEIPLVLGLFFAAPETLVLSRLAGIGAALYFHRRQRSLKFSFNLGLMWLETVVAVIIFRAALGSATAVSEQARLAAFAAAMGAGLLGTLLVAVVSALHDGRLNPGVWLRMVLTGAIAFAANTSLALVAVTIALIAPGALWYLGFVGLVVFAAYRGYSTFYRRHEDLELLYDFTKDVGGAIHVESVGHRLLLRARDLLRAAEAELILQMEGGQEPVRMRLTPDGELEQVEDTLRARGLRDGLLGDAAVAIPRGTKDPKQRAFLSEAQLKDAVLVRFTGDQNATGIVVVGNRLDDVSTFSSEEVRLLQTLTNHASVALANGRLVDRLTLQAAEREHEALHDALTGLPNRTQFQREIDEAVKAQGSKAAVLLLDLNNFKDVNDTLGHEAGDLLLRDIGGRLERALEGTGVVARLGGDEFAVLLPGVGGELAAKNVARELLTVLEQQTTIEGVRVDIGASVGITLCPAHGTEATTLLRRADVAMYSAKAKHKPVEVYDADGDQHSPQRLALVGELRSTLERGELRVVYQPKADLRTGRVVGVEALARWNHPERGFIPPDEFISVAERSGLIQVLTRHVMRTALTQCRIWRLSGLPLNVSVNLSARSLGGDLPAEVARILGETGVAANALTLEITESSIMADPAHTGLVLEELSAMGVHLSIDDFGTGYSSLTYLKRLPVDEIKIDKSFVMGMAQDDDDAAIVRSTVDLGRNLGLRVVAEGIEDGDTWTALTTLGCDMAQGYYLSPPLTPPEFDAWLRSRISNIAAAKPVRAPGDPIVPPATPRQNP